jgi:peptide/nickel transport system ATP-binding protein
MTDLSTGTAAPVGAPKGSSSSADDIVLDVDNLVVEFRSGRQRVQAVSGVTFSVKVGETLGLVGESGCGKSTTGRALVQVQPPTSGVVTYRGQNLSALSPRNLRRVRTKIQMIFQDPISSLNPRRRVRDIVAEPLVIWGRGSKKERAAKVNEMLEAVGIDPEAAGDRRPGEFSGGQCQRISIARALMAEPELLICDEPVSALDVSVQAQILNLMADLKAKFGLTMVFIAHDLGVVKNVSDRVAVMYLGKLVEVAGSDELYRWPAHPYTEALLASIPEPDPDMKSDHKGLSGELPSPLNPPSGCRFRTRCPYVQDRCAEEEPLLRDIGPGHQVACHFPLPDPQVKGSSGGKAVAGAGTGAGKPPPLKTTPAPTNAPDEPPKAKAPAPAEAPAKAKAPAPAKAPAAKPSAAAKAPAGPAAKTPAPKKEAPKTADPKASTTDTTPETNDS